MGVAVRSTKTESGPIHYRYFMNVGPQHPSTHGVLRLIIGLYGEYVLSIEPVIGYGHRMHEKMAQSRPWQAFLPNTARMDYACCLPHQHCYLSLIEQHTGIKVPPRAEYIRVIAVELNRIASHLLWLGAFLLDLGAFTPILYCFDDREEVLDILENLTGARITHCFFRIGGVLADIDDHSANRIREFMRRMRGRFSVYHKLVTENIIFIKRTRDIGIITPDMARRYGATGPVLRGSGIAYDVRKQQPYSAYRDFSFDVPTGSRGDCYDRYLVRVEEMQQSLCIIEQALERMPAGEIRAPVPRTIRLPAGQRSFSVEGARGEVTYYLVADGTDTPYRLKVRSPCYANLNLIQELGQGMLFADMIATLGSLDLVIPEIDR
ncbi:MAG: NADH-quinone oxidoreductase subunit D [Desulfobacterota bacterium]|nr:NADH-quinone oxidoreductase subunit D [Thermodesulfobacteriota bacterium]